MANTGVGGAANALLAYAQANTANNTANGAYFTANLAYTAANNASINTTPNTVSYTANLALTSANNITYRCIISGNVNILSISSPHDGDRVRVWLTANANANVSIANTFVIPTSSTFTSPQVILSGKKAKLLFEYDAVKSGGQWELTSFINGY